ncbi:hypothetical protein [Mycobacterium ostraviense]|uniref:Uncharacterized protein n=1 Tax=Mycobacterium ostraviense TaxID=2738409 RepID=A0A163YMM2_9MYCO|nr:hypothetical protein [Mycobacterium ostraviense]KZS60586.1 hypothetical protein A4G28_01785 [Mycobacterium ostraviense]UGT93431.1 hypothetical protein LTS72_09225 [Mycobacterium ostraviense]
MTTRLFRVTTAAAVAAGALGWTPAPAWADPVAPSAPAAGAHWEVGCPEPLTDLIDRSCFAPYPWVGTPSMSLVGEGTPSQGLPVRNILAVVAGAKVAVALTERDYQGEDRFVRVDPGSTRGFSGDLIVDVRQDRVVP